MSVLKSISDIRIPYPTEGVIRTAQLDDTVTPENSVQLAVNMNFDRVGAIQTRLGVTQYADDLVSAINNYGTLRNAVIPPGFDFIFQIGGNSELSASIFLYPTAVKINDEKIAVFWQGLDGDGFCRNFAVDQVTGSVAPLGALVEFETSQNAWNKAIAVNSGIILNVWQGVGNAAFVRGFDVSGETIVPGAAALQFDSAGFQFSLGQVDSTHFICFSSAPGALIATIFAINLTTLAVTEPGAPLTIESVLTGWSSCQTLGSDRFINFWTSFPGGLAKTQCFSVNTGTWAITAIGSALTFGSSSPISHNNLPVGDGQHFVDIYQQGVFLQGQTFSVNLSTFAVTTVGTPLPAASVLAVNGLTAARFDGSHFLAFYSVGPGSGHVQMIQMNVSTFSLSFIANNLIGYDFGDDGSETALNISSTEVMIVWGGFNTETGKAAIFSPFGTLVEGRWLYAGSGTSVFNTVSGTWVSRRSGLATVSKPRFSQFLNYIWMVNGNEMIGGDPVATSKGGAFGGDLVPANFPKGDFIHAGFEGRVWVANKTTGVIYYTDIVQFTAPATYTLTYDPNVNFISQLAPQTGESFTALFRVPRALLVFTENSIFRIYGATSVDAYPAYNVGTFSQESIIETKTGIFFHHSSGFYQFDYGSQPVEISRRIIDFVQAIPRANYDDITGVYDGFDCVEWSVGQVTVEGVVFVNCVLRYTISTQIWTVYDYVGNVITAMIYYDDGTNLNHLMGTFAGKTGAMDTGFTDFTLPFYFEFIDRWRGFTDMYYLTKSASGFNVYSENAAGANLLYQKQKSGPNAWLPLGTVTEANNAILPNSNTEDFDVMRLRLAGNTKGARVVVHGIEITQLTVKGQEEN